MRTFLNKPAFLTIDVTIDNSAHKTNSMNATNDLCWLRRKTSTDFRRQRTHTEETVSEQQEEDELLYQEVALTLSSTSLHTNTVTGNNKKSVSFCSTVSVYHHPLILGDHPAVRNGVPLMLDWTAIYIEERSLREKKSSKQKLVPALSMYVREVLAQQGGATKDDLRAAREQVRAIQQSRQQSMAYRKWWPFGPR